MSESLPPLAQVRLLSPAALAYLGDAIYELHVRQSYLFPPIALEVYHQQVVQRVRATTQAQTLTQLLPSLTVAEQAIVKWGRNGSGRGPRQIPVDIYRQASALETLLGYLSLTDPKRLAEILMLSDSLMQSPLPP